MTRSLAAIIPAAGRGSRLKPFPCPKELFPVGYQDVRIDGALEKRPKVVSQYLLEHMVSAGAEQVFIVLGEGKSDIMQYYGNGTRFGAHVSYLFQEELHGMPYAIDLARPWLDDHTVLFGMPDTIIEPADCFSQLLAFHDRHGADLTLALFPTDNPSKFGMVDMDENNDVIWTYDKPETSDLRCAWGACCWSPAFTALIGDYLGNLKPGSREVILGDVFNHAIERKMRVKATSFEGAKYIDIGTTAELNLALQQFNL